MDKEIAFDLENLTAEVSGMTTTLTTWKVCCYIVHFCCHENCYLYTRNKMTDRVSETIEMAQPTYVTTCSAIATGVGVL